MGDLLMGKSGKMGQLREMSWGDVCKSCWWEKGNGRKIEEKELEITRKISEKGDRVREMEKRGDTGQMKGK